MLMRFEPFRDLDRVTEEMLSERRPRPVPVDAYLRGDELKVEFDLPGADPGSIELTVENDLLSRGTPMSQPEPYGPEDWSSAAWRVALVDERPDYQMRYSEAWLEWFAARNRVNERLYEAKVAELEQLQQR